MDDLRGKELLPITCNGTERIMFSLKEKNLVAFFPKIMCALPGTCLSSDILSHDLFGENRSEEVPCCQPSPILRFRA